MKPRIALGIIAGLALAATGATAAIEGVGAVPGPRRPDWPKVADLPANVKAALAAEPIKLAIDAETRRIEMMRLRIRNISCAAGAVGSGFAADAHTLITNRHVIAGAAILQADTGTERQATSTFPKPRRVASSTSESSASRRRFQWSQIRAHSRRSERQSPPSGIPSAAP